MRGKRPRAAPRLILASTSRYRSELLSRLGLPFDVRAPEADEHIGPEEPPADAAARLALAKAESVAALLTGGVPKASAGPAVEPLGETRRLVIGADQVPALDGRILRKPGTHEAALAQLEACQGRSVRFFTAAVVLDPRGRRRWTAVDVTDVEFARLGRDTLDRYLAREKPYDCAGGFKAEGLGIALFSAITSRDPTALIGLPLIWLAGALREAGLDPLGTA